MHVPCPPPSSLSFLSSFLFYEREERERMRAQQRAASAQAHACHEMLLQAQKFPGMCVHAMPIIQRHVCGEKETQQRGEKL